MKKTKESTVIAIRHRRRSNPGTNVRMDPRIPARPAGGKPEDDRER